MDYTLYDKNTRQLIEKCETLTVTCDKDAARYLRMLEKRAEELEDNALMGFVFFYFANLYYDRSEYEEYQTSLRKAIRHLLKSDEMELLARSYNFFAIDAQSNGVLDIAYSYYISALNLTDKEISPSIYGTTIHNLATFYFEIGDYENSRKCFREAISLIRKNRKDPFYTRNLIIGYLSECTTSLGMGDIHGTKQTLELTKALLDSVSENLPADVELTYRMLSIRVAHENRDMEDVKTQAEMILDMLKNERVSFVEMADVSSYCMYLIENDMLDEVGEVISAITPIVETAGIAHATLILVGIQIEYYQKIMDESNLMTCLKKQHKLLLHQREEQRKLYRYSKDLIGVIVELREEGAAVRQENENMQVEIATDPLTGIPNRYAMDQSLDIAFEEAWRTKSRLGVGVIDVDGFKEFNDLYGHPVGDLCLQKIASILIEVSNKEGMFCARYGGDEFVVIYEDKDDDEIGRIAKDLAELIAGTELKSGEQIIEKKVTITQGICNDIPGNYTKLWDYLYSADRAMYSAKNSKDSSVMVTGLHKFE